ncbi:SDR family NAD(P)-dependent oxidoreductase [Sorangium sp. So ce1151]|uniref:SDR family NAD(P)-dependent oxidoreductase n=1 Tax=Sorangium sp. So ce1151 TaxID=3133332 RepID=UPI003F61BD15
MARDARDAAGAVARPGADERKVAMGGGAFDRGSDRDDRTSDEKAALAVALRRAAAELLGRAIEDIDPRVPFRALGLDSVGAVALLRRLSAELDRALPLALLWSYPTLESLATYLARGPAKERAATEGTPERQDDPIAIIGMSCRFPGAEDIDAFWSALCRGESAIRSVPPDRWETAPGVGEEGAAPERTSASRWGGFLERVDGFDPLFFGISPREAVDMDPQQRLALELCWEAIEDAGVVPATLKESRTGVYFGVLFGDYAALQSRRGLEAVTAYSSTGTSHCIVANRVSYFLELNGPSMTVETACSSSLVAAHLACQAIRAGECELALIGGVNLMLAPDAAIGMHKLGVMSSTGRCWTFDARADGYVRGEGGGVLLLKPLSRAQRDGDRIYGVIRGSAVNNDGPSNGLTAPNPRAQEAVLRAACARAGVAPRSVQYVEAHGTGTELGDPVEATALGAVYGAGRPEEDRLRIGSVKTNIGHLEAAAGVAGLIKTVLCLHHRTLVPSCNYETPSPHIDFGALRLDVVTGLAPWPESGEGPPRAGVSSFGYGGTNAHMVLEGLPERPVHLLPLGAATPDELAEEARAWLRVLDGGAREVPLGELCGAAASRVRAAPYRLVAEGASRDALRADLCARLASAASLKGPPGAAPEGSPRPVFVFPGIGPQWAGMAQRLWMTEPVFQQALARCDAALREAASWSLTDVLWADAARSPLADPDALEVAFPALTAVQIALVDLWRSLGVEPAAVVGHSSGEVAAAYAAGILSLHDAMLVARELGAIYQRTVASGDGALMVVGAAFEEVERIAAEQGIGGALYLAARNAPGSCLICGGRAALQELLGALESRGVYCHRLNAMSSHCPLVEPFAEAVERLPARLSPGRAEVPMISTVRAGPVEGSELGWHYWRDNICSPVRFDEAMRALALHHRTYLELSPHPALLRYIPPHFDGAGGPPLVLESMRRDEDGHRTIRSAAARLFEQGAALRWEALEPAGDRRLLERELLGDGSERRQEPQPQEAQPQEAQPQEAQPQEPRLLPISAHSEEALAALAGRYRDHLARAAWPALCASAARRRAHHRRRLAVVAASGAEADRKLGEVLRDGSRAIEGVARGRSSAEGPPRLVFVLPSYDAAGAGASGAARVLSRWSPVFREALLACDRALAAHGCGVTTELLAEGGAPRLARPEVAHPAVFAVQVALVALLRSWGVAPDAVVGDGLGEIAAAHLSGALSLDDAARVVAAQSRVIHALPLDDSAAAGLEVALEGLSSVAPSVPFWSTVAGDRVAGAHAGGAALDASHWTRNLHEPSRLDEAIQGLALDRHALFLEIGPDPVPGQAIQRSLQRVEAQGVALPLLQTGRDEREMMLRAAGELYCRGLDLDWSGLYPEGDHRVPLPRYAWQRQRYWLPDAPAPRSASGASAAAAAPPAAAPPAAGASHAVRFYHATWREAGGAAEAPPEGPVLVLARDPSAGRALARHLRGQPVVVVKPGGAFRQEEEATFEIDPRRADHYRHLAEKLRERGAAPRHVLHLWSLGAEAARESLAEKLDRGIHSLLPLLQEMRPREGGAPLSVRYVYPSSDRDPGHVHAAVAGFARSVRQESDRLRLKVVGLSVAEHEAFHLDAWLGRIVGEWDRGAEVEVRLDGSRRLVRRFAALDPAQGSEGSGALRAFKEEGVHVITGGAGGLGVLFARHLARTSRARVALCGRSAPDPRTQAVLREIDALGGQAAYFQADVSDSGQAAALIQAVKRRFSRVDGVIHAAGVLRDGLCLSKTRKDMAEVLAPKVLGTLALDEATRDEPLDLFVMFSSFVGALGNVGQSDYAYANRFMDEFAVWREAQRARGARAGKTLSIGWPLWRAGGMQMDRSTAQRLELTLGMLPLTTTTGLDAFDRGLRLPHEAFLVLEGVPERLDGALGVGATVPAATPRSAPRRSATAAEDAALIARFQKELLEIIGAILSIAPRDIDPQEEMSCYGFDSTTFVELTNQLNTSYGVDLTPSVFFEHRTIGSIVRTLCGSHGDAIRARWSGPAARSGASAGDGASAGALVTQPPAPPLAAEAPPAPASGGSIGEPGNEGTAQAGSKVAGGAPPATAAPRRFQPALAAGPLEREPIAVVGMSGVFPASGSVDELWSHLEVGRDLIEVIPRDRWTWEEHWASSEEPDKTAVRWGGFMKHVDRFDAAFFGISPREAALMDPQQRILVETTWKAIEDAGYRPSSLSGSRTGVYVGIGNADYREVMARRLVPAEAHLATGVLSHAIAPNRISYLLNLHGPSEVVDSACSSSLVAVCRAVDALLAGECDAALAGGVNVILSPTLYISLSKAGMLSPDGRCKTFDKDADGYVRSEGAGMLMLKRLSRAIADGDPIHGILRGHAVNHGGRVNTLTTPNPSAQAALVAEAWQRAGVDPATASYIETHGTGTKLGDPIEIEGLKKAFEALFARQGAAAPDAPFCALGSIKTNIGHLETAAGIAGLIKILLAMKHKKLPGNLHFRELNPYIRLEGSPFFVLDRTVPWEPIGGAPRRAGISSFGFGGVNAHVVIEDFEASEARPGVAALDARAPRVVVLSARSEERLRAQAAQLCEHLRRVPLSAEPEVPRDLAELVGRDLLLMAAGVLRHEPDDIEPEGDLLEIGFDQVGLSVFTSRINERYHLHLTPHGLGAHHSLRTLAQHLCQSFEAPLRACYQAARPPSQPAPPAGPIALADLAYTLQVGREPMNARLAVVASDIAELSSKLDLFVSGRDRVEGLFHGSVRGRDDDLMHLVSGTEGRAFLDAILESQNLAKLARLWVLGADVDWEMLYPPGEAPRRISLPGYAFAPDRHWFSAPEAPAARARGAAHPFLDGLREEEGPAGRSIVAHRIWRATDPQIRDHVVHGQVVAPGAIFLEMARAAAARVAEAFALIDVVWPKPLILGPGEAREVTATLSARGDRWRFEVQSHDGPEVCRHAEGWIEPAAAADEERLSIEAIKARAPLWQERGALYRRFERSGLQCGPCYAGLEGAWSNEREALSRWTAQAPHEEEPRLGLPPSAVVAVFQTIAGLKPHGTSLPVPFAVERVALRAPLPRRAHIHVEIEPSARRGLCYRATILDDSGRVCARLDGISVKESERAPGTARADRMLFVPRWVPRALPPPAAGSPAPWAERTLVLYTQDGAPLKEALAELLGRDRVVALRIEGGRGRTGEAPLELAMPGEAFGAVIFLGGVRARPWDVEDARALEEGLEHGAFALLHLVRELAARRAVDRPRRLCVVASDVYAVLPGARTNPAGATLYGLCRALAHELPELQVSCLDLGLDEQGGAAESSALLGLARAVLDEPPHPDGAVTAIRRGQRHCRVIAPALLSEPAAEAPPLRPRGTYLILGGAGRLGVDVSRSLARKLQARLVWVGRSPLDAGIQAKIAAVEAEGGEVLYAQADAADPAALRAAVAQARARFGAVNGAFHSALEYQGAPLASMDAATFARVLSPKVEGSVALYRALAEEPLDFLVFFSSIQSFTGDKSQSNYAAGCAFKDAFADHLRARAPFPVKTINWGYWQSGDEEYDRRLVTLGYQAIPPEAGVDALLRLLSSPVHQALAVMADDDVLAAMGVDLGHEAILLPRRYPPLPSTAPAMGAAPAAEEVRRALKALDELDRWGRRALARQLGAMGLFRAEGRSIDREALREHLGIVPRHGRFFEAALDLLAREGVVRVEGDRVTVGAAPAFAVEAAGAPGGPAFSGIGAHVALLSTCLQHLPAILAGEALATELLFPGGSMARVEGIYRDNPVADHFNRLVARRVVEIVRARLAHLGEGETLDVLEIGAGTGGTSAIVLEALAPLAGRVRYVYTDVSRAFLRHGEQRFGQAHPFAAFERLDIEREPGEQGFSPGSFDVILATNVLHATRSMRATLTRVKRLLRAHGWLIVNEQTAAQDYNTLTFGLLDGWWLYEDGELRVPGSPLLDAEGWRGLLAGLGFERLGLESTSIEGLRPTQHVITAESDGRVIGEERRPARGQLDARPGSERERSEPAAAERGTRPAEATSAAPTGRPAGALDGDAVKARIARRVVAEVALALGSTDAEVPTSAPFVEYGVDSIIGVDLVNRLNGAFGIALRTTVIFDYPDVNALSELLWQEHGEAIAARWTEGARLDGQPPARLPEEQAPRRSADDLFRHGPSRRDVSAPAPAPAPAPAGRSLAAPAMFTQADGGAAVGPAPRVVSTDIAVIGMSGRFPGASSLDAYWQNLAAGVCSVTEVPTDRWDPAVFYDPDPRDVDKTYSKWGGFLDDVDSFDASFFNISGKEADLSDPQQRLFLQEAFHALEDAGYADASVSGARCGVFVGADRGEYLSLLRDEGARREGQCVWGNDVSVLASRISYFLDLKGPALAVHTACSSSLVAVHLACRALMAGDCDMALAGGIFVNLTADWFILWSNGSMLSPAGECRAFDNRADGFVPGEGVGVVVLKPLHAALRDGDRIAGIIKGSGVNQDGRTNGISAPSTLSQTELEVSVYERSGVSPATIGYVEAHGTGTKLGDPIEVEALTQAFRRFTDERQYCAIGSVKTNIGHAATAAGMAGLLKILLAMQHGEIPPSLHFREANEHIEFASSPFFVSAARTAWRPIGGAPRRAAISAFGIGGTNAHLVLEEPPARDRAPVRAARPWYPVVLSARTEDALHRKIADLDRWLEQGGADSDLGDVAYTLVAGKPQFKHRAAFVASDGRGLRESTRAALREGAAEGFVSRRSTAEPAAPQESGARLVGELREARALPPQSVREKLIALAELWVRGGAVDWNALLGDGGYQRLSLPTYPFAQERHWFTARGAGLSPRSGPLHPMLDALELSESLGEGLSYVKDISGAAGVELRVSGQTLLCPFALLEMARVALEHARPGSGRGLRAVTWGDLPPLHDGVRRLRVALHRQEGDLAFRIQADGKEDDLLSGQGAADPPGEGAGGEIAVASVIARCQGRLDGEAFHASLERCGLQEQADRRVIQVVHVGEGEALARYELPRSAAREAARIWLHPALLTGALHVAASLEEGRIEASVPASLAGVEVSRAPRGSGFIYARKISEGRYHLALLDEEGQVCVKLQELRTRPLRRGARCALFLPRWVAAPGRAGDGWRPDAGGRDEGRTVVVVYPPAEQALAAALTEVHGGARVLAVRLGSRTRRLDARSWEVDTADPGAWEQPLRDASPVSTLHFLGGISRDAAGLHDGEALDRCLEQGLFALFRLVKAMSRAGLLLAPLRLQVVTSRAFPVLPGEVNALYSGALLGWSRSLAGEYPEVRVEYVDLDLGEAGEPLTGPAREAVLGALMDGSADVAAWRGGQRFVPTIEPLSLPPDERSAFRPGGVYLIVGGAGGIGHTLGLHLARRYKARLILIGRRPEDEEIRGKVKRIEALGGAALYLRADVADPAGLRAAVDAGKARFGALHGVVHSALLLQDRTIERMDEATLRAALAPKVQGSQVLCAVTRGEPLDFILFFSSAQSQASRPGQSNYAAASTFQDAFALGLARRLDTAVKVLNWGYWGSVGVVADDRHRERFAAMGIGSIEPDEGMAAVEQALTARVDRVMPVKAAPHALVELGCDLGRQCQHYPESGLPLLQQARSRIGAPPAPAGALLAFQDGFGELVRLGQRCLLAAFQRLGVFRASGERHELAALKAALRIAPAHERLFPVLLAHLAEAGWLELDGGGSRVTVRSAPRVERASLEREKERLLAAHPEIQHHAALLWLCLERYPDVLTGAVAATDVMFPGASLEKVEGVHKGNVLTDYFNRRVVDVVLAYVRERSPQLGGDERIQVLEIGAGTGGTSEPVLEALAPYGSKVRYVYTDVSRAFTRHGADAYGPAYPFATFALLDVERPVEPQGFSPASFDLVLASNVLHATAALRVALANAKALLKTGGWLVLNEVTENHPFNMLTFGLLKGWWLFDDATRRLPASPLLSAPMWEQLLREEGFTTPLSLGPPGGMVLGFSQHVIVAQSDGVVSLPRQAAGRAGAEQTADARAPGRAEQARGGAEQARGGAEQAPGGTEQARGGAEQARGGAEQAPGGTEPPAPHRHANGHGAAPPRWQGPAEVGKPEERAAEIGRDVERAIVACLGEVLQTDRQRIDRDAPFMDLGVDSLLAIRVVDRINKQLGITLRTSDAYSYPSVRELASHVLASFAADVRLPGAATIDTAALFGHGAAPAPVDEARGGAPEGDEPLWRLLRGVESGALDVDEACRLLELP